MNKLVARFADGRMLKGMTVDFSMEKDTFHVFAPPPDPGWDRVEVPVDELKALFFVKDFDGDPLHVDRPTIEAPLAVDERLVQVRFKDGETVLGTTQQYRPAQHGFFLTPLDPDSNNLRMFVVDTATEDISYM